LQKGFNFKNVLKLFCIDSGWIPVEGPSESIGGGEFYQHSFARLEHWYVLKYSHERPTAVFNFKVFFLTAVPATKWLKKTGWASQFVFLRH
jgi:hypothetical protein